LGRVAILEINVLAQATVSESYTFHPDAPPPWIHQLEAFERFKDSPYCGLFFDQRCGKTRDAVDIVGYRFEVVRDIDAMLVIAWPSGVHRNWCVEEIPRWLPPRIPRRSVIWRAGRYSTKAFEEEFALLLRSKGLAIFAVNAEALITPSCREHIQRFLEARRGVALIVDECDWASSPGSIRTDKIQKIATWHVIKLKMILSGTPATESPFQLFSQMNILKPDFFGFKTYQSFRHHFGAYEFEPAPVQVPLRRPLVCRDCKENNLLACAHGRVQRFKNGHVKLIDKINPKTGELVIEIDRRTKQPKMRPKRGINHDTSAQFDKIFRDDDDNPRYRNLDELHAKMAPYVMRVLRSEVSDAPEKIYQKRFYEMSKEQQRVYDDLTDKFQAELKSGLIVSAAHVLTRWLRLQQVLSNRFPARTEGVICDECAGEGCFSCDNVGIVLREFEPEVIDPDHDPRLDALELELNASRSDKAIIWCRFRHEVTQVIELVNRLGGLPVRFDGEVPEKDRLEALHGAFRQGSATHLVGNPAAGQRGLPMDVANLAVFNSNYFSGRLRRQTEDRTEAVFKKVATGIVDIVCIGSIDERLVHVLRHKQELSELIVPSNLKEWL
jgi:hypothetical protein